MSGVATLLPVRCCMGGCWLRPSEQRAAAGRAQAASALATAMGSGSGPASEGSSPTAVPSSGGSGAGGALLTSCTALALGAVGCGVWGLVRRAVRSRAASTRASELLVCRPAVNGRGRWPAAYRS
jgi:hypothetical protein|eukprot:COSAG01_NODE_3506_length_5991_cov_16.426680_3_plen_125_part_00